MGNTKRAISPSDSLHFETVHNLFLCAQNREIGFSNQCISIASKTGDALRNISKLLVEELTPHFPSPKHGHLNRFKMFLTVIKPVFLLLVAPLKS